MSDSLMSLTATVTARVIVKSGETFEEHVSKIMKNFVGSKNNKLTRKMIAQALAEGLDVSFEFDFDW